MTDPTSREDAVEVAVRALAEKRSIREEINPQWRHADLRRARKEGREYDIPGYRERSLERRMGDSCTVVEHGPVEEGYGAIIRALTYREVAEDIVDALIAAGLLHEPGAWAREGGPIGPANDRFVGIDDGLTEAERDEAARRWQEGPARPLTAEGVEKLRLRLAEHDATLGRAGDKRAEGGMSNPV